MQASLPATDSQDSKQPLRFPIGKLDSPSNHNENLTMKSLLSHTENLTEADDMDWTPTQSASNQLYTLNISPRVHNQAPALPYISPFRGSLPAAPISPAHRLQNPPVRAPIFKPSSSKERDDFFQRMREQHQAKFGDLPAGSSTKGELPMQPARLQLQESQPETGLEDMLGSISMSRDSPALSVGDHEKPKETTKRSIANPTMISVMAAAVALSVAIVFAVLQKRNMVLNSMT
jgi:hypothetical protein